MINLKVLRENFFFFPITFIILHATTYGLFFIWLCQQSSEGFLNFVRGNLFWFSGFYWINWASFWVIYYLAYRQRKFKLALSYILAILGEFFFVNIETVVGSLEGVQLSSVDYEFIFTRLHFINSEIRTVVHYSLFLAIAQLLIGLLKKKEMSYENLG